MVKELWRRFVRWLARQDWGSGVNRAGHPSPKEVGFIRSYIRLRIVVGAIGIALPLVLWLGEATVLDAPLHARDSISSYYHSPMRDWFVASLAVIGVLLVTYMLGTWNREFWVSTIAGLALLGVAFFPTERPHVQQGHPLCEATPKPADCTDLEHRLGEVRTGNIHLTSAAIALSSLGVIALLWSGRAKWSKDRPSSPYLALFHLVCGVAILAALCVALSGWVFSRWRLFGLTPLYFGEVMTVFAFGLSWIAQGRDLGVWLHRELNPAQPGTPEAQAGTA